MDAPVLLTGGTGYIGGPLLRHFEEAGRPVRCLARNPERAKATRSTTEVVQGDCLDEASLNLALAGVDSVYYLVHSMSVGADFAEVDRQPQFLRLLPHSKGPSGVMLMCGIPNASGQTRSTMSVVQGDCAR